MVEETAQMPCPLSYMQVRRKTIEKDFLKKTDGFSYPFVVWLRFGPFSVFVFCHFSLRSLQRRSGDVE